MLKYMVGLLLLVGSAWASDVRVGVGISVGPSYPVPQTVVVERPTLVWVPPVYEQRYDANGNPYLVVVREGYYQQVYQQVYQPVIYAAPLRPSFSFGFFFGSPWFGGRGHCAPPPRGPIPHHGR